MIQLLVILTLGVNLLALTGALWLGLYIVTRSSRSLVSWLAALSLWFLAIVFLRNALLLDLPGSSLLYRLRLVGFVSLPLWFHMTFLLPLERTDRLSQLLSYPIIRMGMISLAYLLAILIIIHNLFFSDPIPISDLPPLYISGRASGSSNPYLIVYMLVIGSLVILNLWPGWVQAGQARRKKLLTTMLMVSIPALLAGLYLTVGPWLHPALPVFPGDAILGACVFLLGYNVARYNALIEGRTIERDALYTLIGIGLISLLYGLVALTLNLSGQASFLTLVLILVCAIITHSLYDTGRAVLDRLFYQRQFQELRANLRLLAREIGTEQALPDQLQAILSALCRTLHIKQGFIALRRVDIFVIEAKESTDSVRQTFPLSALVATESMLLPHSGIKGAEDMRLLIPLSAGGMQLGALALGSKVSDQPYREEELELLDDLADQIAIALHTWRLPEENAQAINQIVGDFLEIRRSLQRQAQQLLAEREKQAQPVLGDVGEKEFIPLVEECLRQLHDFSYLGRHRLAGLQLVNEQLDDQQKGHVTHIDRGKALHELLLQLLAKLRPAGADPQRQAVPSREWHQFIILHDAYVQNKMTREIMSRLYISEPTFHRTRRRAIRSVARVLREMEQAAQHSLTRNKEA
jgi:hypothetical protein